MRKSLLFLLFMFVFISPFVVIAEGDAKHPRVAELESALVKDASEFLKGRFPDVPFIVSAQLDPLRRPGSMEKNNGETLPYLELQDEEIRDEWDDPSIPLRSLIVRSKKVVINVSVPSSVENEDLEEIKQSLQTLLNLVPVRDEVKVQKRAWNISAPSLPLYVLPGAGVMLLSFLVGLFLISRGSVNKLVQSMRESRQTPAAPSAPSMPSAPSSEKEERSSAKAGSGGDLKFSDPFKTRELIQQSIQTLATAPVFPTLMDMIVLDKFAKQKPAALGALLSEFPKDLQKKIFSYSTGDYWLEAFNDPGELNSDSLEVLQKLLRHKHEEGSKTWEELLLLAWRLNDSRIQFVRSLKEDEALSLLYRLPKSISITTARAVFPGNWGALLKTNFVPKKLDDLRLHAMTQSALTFAPLRDITLLDTYRHDRDLLDYLKIAEPSEEREIYIASAENSLIHSIRPPFFKIFELEDSEIDFLVDRLSIEDWSLAMFNLGKTERRQIEARFPEKKKFMYIERLKALDANPPEKTRIGATREKIAKIIESEIIKKKSADVVDIKSAGGARAA